MAGKLKMLFVNVVTLGDEGFGYHGNDSGVGSGHKFNRPKQTAFPTFPRVETRLLTAEGAPQLIFVPRDRPRLNDKFLSLNGLHPTRRAPILSTYGSLERHA